MDKEFKSKERTLEILKIDDEIADERRSIAEKKAMEAEMKKQYGSGWRKILGFTKHLKPNLETMHDLYSLGDTPVGGLTRRRD